ncbi:MAG: HAMP domain-containing protein, partial [bacterium]
MKPVSIRTTIFLALLATSLIGIILSSFFIYQDSSRIIKRQAEQYYNAETKNIENRLEQHISLLLSQLNRVSKNSLLINALIDETGREQYLPQFLHSISFSKNFSQVDLSFHDFELTLIESNHKNRALLWYTLNNKNSISNSVFKRKKTYLSFQKSIQQKNLLVIAIPVFYENLPEGALVAAFSWKHIWKDLLEGKQHLAMQALFKDQIISKSGNNTTEGVVKTVQIITIPNLKISITIPSNLLKDPIREMLQILLIRSFPILIILILITTFLLSRKITQPLIYFTSITSQIAKGNWKKVHLTGANTELTALAKSFNRMISALEHSHNNVEDSYQKLEEEKKKQLKQAYVAGITENAISVLHNIGNAITPAVVNIQEMLDFKNSLEIKHFFIKIHNIIEKALEEGRIETLFTEDPSGKQILPFLQE